MAQARAGGLGQSFLGGKALRQKAGRIAAGKKIAVLRLRQQAVGKMLAKPRQG
jgi:hypothetical protein